MSYAPQKLLDLQALWVANSGVPLGIVGDASHIAGGTSYHLGKDHLIAGAYSARLPRDVTGLDNAASAIDLGKLHGSYFFLQAFSRWFVAQVRANPTAYRDVREVIYSPDGTSVRRWDDVTNTLYVGGDGTGQGDNTHLTHTHISWYRDSENRTKTQLFAPYFAAGSPATTPDTPPEAAVGLFLSFRPEPPQPGKIKGAGHSVFRVADANRWAIEDGHDMGLVRHANLIGTLPSWAQGDPHVVVFDFNQYGLTVAVIRDVTLGPAPLSGEPIGSRQAGYDDAKLKAIGAVQNI